MVMNEMASMASVDESLGRGGPCIHPSKLVTPSTRSPAPTTLSKMTIDAVSSLFLGSSLFLKGERVTKLLSRSPVVMAHNALVHKLPSLSVVVK